MWYYGSMPKGMNDNFFAQLITTLKKANVMALDSDEKALAWGLNAGPFLINRTSMNSEG